MGLDWSTLVEGLLARWAGRQSGCSAGEAGSGAGNAVHAAPKSFCRKCLLVQQVMGLHAQLQFKPGSSAGPDPASPHAAAAAGMR